jgi:small basic protein
VNQLWGPALELLGLVILLFPDGRLASRPWVWALRAYCLIFGLELIALTVATVQAVSGAVVHVDRTGGLAATDHPNGWYGVVDQIGLVALLAFMVAFIARQALSWRRSAGERRQQLKWLASGAAVTVCCAVLSPVFGLAWFGFAALPVSIGVGILKYRLYEIDRIISRTLAYSIVTGLLIGVYAGLVLLATRVPEVHTPVAVAAATLAAAALFTPVRRRVQHIVDRRFNRARYDADRTVAAFSARLQDAVDLGTVRDDLVATVRTSLEPALVSIWAAGGDR